jgi:polyhydroxybutyrate depolymerase
MCKGDVALALLALLAFAGCSGHDGGSDANPASGSGGMAGLGTGGAETGSGSGGARGTATSGTGGSGKSAPGAGASGAGGSGTGASDDSDAGGDGASGAGGMMGADGGTPPTPGDCVGDWEAGTYPPDFITSGDALSGSTSLPAIGGYDYAVHVPKGYDCHLPTPILFGLHGLGMNGYSFNVAGSSTPTRPGGLVAKADEAGFILVMPTGMGPTEDAVQAIRDIFKNLETHLNIDHKRVYATGHSFGGALSYWLACTAADLFTAVAPNAWTMTPTPCNPAQPVSVLASDGDQDTIAPGGGDLTPAITALVAAEECSTMATPATVPASGGDTTCVTYPGCKGGVEVTACIIKGGGHVWFGDPSCGTGADACSVVGNNSEYYVNTDFAWDFLKRFSR